MKPLRVITYIEFHSSQISKTCFIPTQCNIREIKSKLIKKKEQEHRKEVDATPMKIQAAISTATASATMIKGSTPWHNGI